MPRVSLRDIAKRLALSHSTVSLALRDHPRISPEVRAKIHQTAEAMGYRPDPILAALAHYRHGKTESQHHAVVAWLNFWPKPEKLRGYHEFDLYWRGASSCAEKHGYHIEEFICGENCTPQRLEKILLTRNITGLLIPPHPSQPQWNDFSWTDFSVVRFGRSCRSPAAQVVTSDQVANTMMAFDRIRERGYQRVGFATGRAADRGVLFKAGFLMAQSSLPEELRLPVLCFEGGISKTSPQALKEFSLWLKKYKPEAILTDIAELPEMLEKIGWRVPQDVGVVAESVLDGNADAGIFQNPEEIGRVAFLTIMSLLNDNSRGIPAIFRQVLVSGDWREGSTLPWRQETDATKKRDDADSAACRGAI